VVKKSKKVNIFPEAEIEDTLLNLVKEMQRFLDKHPSPKEFAGKLLSTTKSDSAIDGQIQKRHSLDMEPYQTISPQELWKILPQEMQDKRSSKYLKPDQRTYILHQLQQGGYYEPQKKSKNIKYPGRPKSAGIPSAIKERGGRPSVFTITPDILRLKKFISNENACQYIHNRLKSIGILQEFFNFILLSFFHALRKKHNEGKKETLVDSLIPLLPFFSIAKDINLSNWNEDQILSKDETQLTKLAQEISCIAAENPLTFLLFIEAAF
jgi:hypothetical protein